MLKTTAPDARLSAVVNLIVALVRLYRAFTPPATYTRARLMEGPKVARLPAARLA